MSNVGRPREGMKPCPHCGSSSRDSNGQCRCRNTLYRLRRKHAETETGCGCGWTGKSHPAHFRAVLRKAS